MLESKVQRPETVLFVGAGATSCLGMPTTDDQARVLWLLCDEKLTAENVEKTSAGGSKCFKGYGQAIVDLLNVVGSCDCNDEILERAFPNVDKDSVKKRVAELRRCYDWEALKLVAKAKKGNDPSDSPRDNYLQEVFTLIDACLRDERGFNVYDGDDLIFLSVYRLKAARELLVLLINTMFACAWKRQINNTSSDLPKYQKFFNSLALCMQEEGRRFEKAGIALNKPEFYQHSYATITTNFEPIFLWLIWQGHLKANHGKAFRVGNPGRKLKLLMNFPTMIGMRAPVDDEKETLDASVWLPCTEAVAQNVNNPKYSDDRAFRVGSYSPVHGMSNTRHCPVCGRLNLYVGDVWNEKSETLFVNGPIAPLKSGQKPRTEDERRASESGEYDALSCHFCGARTHLWDNFMFMQTQLKSTAPSFLKEITDMALSQIAGAKHIVLLGYSLPLDDAIWGSLFTTMTRRKKSGEQVYCSVVLYASGAEERWLYGKELESFIEKYGKNVADREKVRGLNNAIAVFGRDHVRAYMAGIPKVFGDGTEKDVLNLMYPTNVPGWKISAFTYKGVVR